jgi:hypothetical protein
MGQPMKSLACLLCAIIMLIPAPLAVAYCRVPQPRLTCAEYFASPLVVEATLVRTHVLGDKADPLGISAYVYTMRVNNVLRGKVKGNLRIYEGNDSGRAPFDWIPGKEYLLFLFYVSQEKSWELDGCGNSWPLDTAKAALSEIETIKAAHDGGVIYGTVSHDVLYVPIPGVHIEVQGEEVQGENVHYATATNEKGEFQMNVPAGRYSLRVVERGILFKMDGISYEDPGGIQIEPGGCVQIQFVEVEGSQ